MSPPPRYEVERQPGGRAAQAQARRFAAVPARVAVPAWAWVLAATVVGIALRVVWLGTQSLGYEEAYTYSIVGHGTVAGVWDSVKATESTPPLYYVLTWLWVQLTSDHGAASLRVVSMVAGSATVPVAFAAARTLFDRRVAIVVAWLCAINPWLIIESDYARSYALLVLVATASVWALGALLERPTPRRWLVWAVAAVACVWTHYFTVFLLVGEVAVLVIALPRERRGLAAALAGVVALAAPLWPMFHAQSGASQRTDYIGAQSLASRLEGTVRSFSMGLNVPAAWLEALGIVLVAGGLVWALARTYRRRETRVVLGIALLGAGLPVLTALAGIDDHYLPRNVLGIWICLAALAAYGLLALRGVPLLVYSVICIATAVIVQSNWHYQGSADWRGAATTLGARAAGEPIAVLPGLHLNVASLYLHRAPLAAPTSTRNMWVIVEPARAAGHRDLEPVADPPLQLWGTAFRDVGELDHQGFRIIHLRAATPQPVAPAPPGDGSPTSPTALLLGVR